MNPPQHLRRMLLSLLWISLLSLLFFSCTPNQKQDISYVERLPSDDQRCQPGAAVGNSWICIPQPPGMLEVKDSTLLDSLFANENQLVMAYFVDSAEWRAFADTATDELGATKIALGHHREDTLERGGTPGIDAVAGSEAGAARATSAAPVTIPTVNRGRTAMR